METSLHSLHPSRSWVRIAGIHDEPSSWPDGGGAACDHCAQPDAACKAAAD